MREAMPDQRAAKGASGDPGDVRTMVRVDNVTKQFGSGGETVLALDDVSVTIGENEFFTLLGPSGCGKTTLLRLIAGFDHPTSGRIMLQGQDISHLPPYQRPVNTVFQSYALFPLITMAQNISFGMEMLGKPKAEVAETVGAMLRLVRMEELRDRRTDQISGGQQQRVVLARALAPRPRFCCSTSRCRRSTTSCARTCRSSSRGCSTRPGSPSSSSPMTRRRR